MTTKEMREIYKTVTGFYQQDPVESDYGFWRDVLGNYDKADVMRAITRWSADDTEIELSGGLRARGSFFPKPADIKAILESAKRKVVADAKAYQPCHGSFADGTFCSSGTLCRRTVHPTNGNTQVRLLGHCECWIAWKGLQTPQRIGPKAVAAETAADESRRLK